MDITNYVRAELGQPLHAFDLAKIKGGKIIVKTLPEGTVFKSLDGVERKLLAEDLMICDGESNPMCIGGVFGGADSGVSDATTAIFLESAIFHPQSIRRSMLRHNLRTDAAWAFEKGVDPNGSLRALERAAPLIIELAGGATDSGVTDIYPAPIHPARVEVAFDRINRLIGETFSPEKIGSSATFEIGIDNGTGNRTDGGYTNQQTRCHPRSGGGRGMPRTRLRRRADSYTDSQQHGNSGAPESRCSA